MWSQALDLLLAFENGGSLGIAGTSGSLDEFLLTLLLTKHPHNYSADFQRGARPPSPRLIRDAEYLMAQGDSALTVGRIAEHLRVSLRTLESGFREHKGVTPLRRLREIRLQKVRDQLIFSGRGNIRHIRGDGKWLLPPAALQRLLQVRLW